MTATVIAAVPAHCIEARTETVHCIEAGTETVHRMGVRTETVQRLVSHSTIFFSVIVQPLPSHCASLYAVTVQSLCTVTVQTLCSHSARSLCSHCAESLCSRCAVTVQSLCSRCAVLLQSLCTVTEQRQYSHPCSDWLHTSLTKKNKGGPSSDPVQTHRPVPNHCSR